MQPLKENEEGLHRATYEAYTAIGLAAITVIFNLVWWWKTIFALVIVAILIDIAFNSKLTVKQGRRRYLYALAATLLFALAAFPSIYHQYQVEQEIPYCYGFFTRSLNRDGSLDPSGRWMFNIANLGRNPMHYVSAVVWDLTVEEPDLSKIRRTGIIPIIHSFWKNCASSGTSLSYGLKEIGSKYQITIILEDGTELTESLTFENGEQCIDVWRSNDGKTLVNKMRPQFDVEGGCDPNPPSCKKR